MTKNIEEILSGIRKVLEENDKQKEPVKEYPDNLMDGYLIFGCGKIHSASCAYPLEIIKDYYDHNNWRPTFKTAEKEVKRRAVIQKIRHTSKKFNKNKIENKQNRKQTK